MLAALVEEVEKRYRTSFFVSGVAHSLAQEAHEENELHLQRVGVFDMSCAPTPPVSLPRSVHEHLLFHSHTQAFHEHADNWDSADDPGSEASQGDQAVFEGVIRLRCADGLSMIVPWIAMHTGLYFSLPLWS